ncbi:MULTISPECIES: glycosyltransferase family 4 protein [Calothrix]|uniref:Glycosyltransferase family 4 protein n=2 Tax=Calothrix TaxID=1186 RepID=A0ABR8AD18_9CYAN|nr:MULTISPECIES: glycosyltransferase family 1 protein [Calothrix]MBD2197808.1 glycosyltransferase family 4 protein [Calothrix parietina FACHB-288]MBD2226212.1 glycosyltransferase family 4 protein [Calothrix anomala FACHB-343]
MRIGYWLGKVNIKHGGSAPYAWRTLEVLLNHSQSYEIDILILCDSDMESSCRELINKYQARAEICLVPQWIIFLNKLLFSRKVNMLRELFFKMPIKAYFSTQIAQYFKPWLIWFKFLKIDLLHIPEQTPPYYDLPYPFVITMHDVQQLHYPEFFTSQELAWRTKYYAKAIDKSEAIIVSFNHIKQDLVKFFGLPERKVHVCPLPYQKIDLPHPGDEDKLIYQQKYSQWNNFLLYPAQTWEHKNHLALIKALELIKDKFGRIIHIVCTGKKNPAFFPVIEDYLKNSQVANQVHFVDIVPETELHWLYKNCSLVVIPTLYEAGSFPLLEAMYLGTPVICSAVTSLPETIDDTRFIFDPLNIEQIANLILKILDDSGLQGENILKGKLRIEQLRTMNNFPSILQVWKTILAE